jgi:threo-3-hydroxy-L-aspartate ammonia-lyase
MPRSQMVGLVTLVLVAMWMYFAKSTSVLGILLPISILVGVLTTGAFVVQERMGSLPSPPMINLTAEEEAILAKTRERAAEEKRVAIAAERERLAAISSGAIPVSVAKKSLDSGVVDEPVAIAFKAAQTPIAPTNKLTAIASQANTLAYRDAPNAAGDPVRFADIVAAHERLKDVAMRTPVLTSRTLDARTGATLFLKCENFQRSGAFKFRGAYNALSQLSADQRKKGVVTHSSGNHAGAIALAGKILGIQTVIVMPQDAPAVKLAATKEYGAKVVLYDKEKHTREAISQQIVDKYGLTLIPPFDHHDVIAGQGTAAKELIEEVGELDVLMVCCGGGGLLSGSAISAKAMLQNVRVIGVEPQAGDDATRSFATKLLQVVHNPETIADGARTSSLGKLTFPLVLKHVDAMLTVSDEALIRTMHTLAERLKIIVEPTGCLALAAVLEGAVNDIAGKRVGVIISGGNVDLADAATYFQPG